MKWFVLGNVRGNEINERQTVTSRTKGVVGRTGKKASMSKNTRIEGKKKMSLVLGRVAADDQRDSRLQGKERINKTEKEGKSHGVISRRIGARGDG